MKLDFTPKISKKQFLQPIIIVYLRVLAFLLFSNNTIYSQANIDAALFKFPYSAQGITKPYGNTATINVIIKNNGIQSLQSTVLKYSYMNATVVSSNWTGNLNAGDTISFSFSTPIIVVQGKNPLKVWVEKVGDTIHSNDTNYFDVLGCVVKNLPYFDNFDGISSDFLSAGPENLWERGIPSDSIINSAYSGQKAWVTNLDGDYPNNADEYLYTPYFNLDTLHNYSISFDYQYKFDTIDNRPKYSEAEFGKIEYSTNSGKFWNNLTYFGDPLALNGYNNNYMGIHGWACESNGWVHFTYYFENIQLKASGIQFRFRFISNNANTDEGWAIDNFAIGSTIDLAVDSIISPQDTIPYGSSITVKIVLKNNGTLPVTTAPVYYYTNISSTVSETWNGNLLPGDTAIYTFTTPFAPSSNFTQILFRAFVIKSGDFNNLNDSSYRSVNVALPLWDAAMTKVMVDTVNIFSSSKVKIIIVNFGSSTINNLICKYIINNGLMVSENWTGTLIAGDSLEYLFVDSFICPNIINSITSQIILVNDQDTTNNTIIKNFICYTGIENIRQTNYTLLQNSPNPAGGNTQIGFEIPISGKVKFQLTNPLGQLIESDEKYYSIGKNSINLDVSKLPAGIYYYSIEMEGRRLVRRMIIE